MRGRKRFIYFVLLCYMSLFSFWVGDYFFDVMSKCVLFLYVFDMRRLLFIIFKRKSIFFDGL